MNRLLMALAVLPAAVAPVAAQVATFSVRNQPVDQVLLAFAERTGLSVVTDATVTGSISLVLHDATPDRTIREIADAAGLFVDRRSGVYHLSRVQVTGTDEGWTAASRGGSLASLARALARASGISVILPLQPYPDLHLRRRAPSPTALLQAIAEAVNVPVEIADGVVRLGTARGARAPVPSSAVEADITLTIDGTEVRSSRGDREAVVRALAENLGVPLVVCGPISGTAPALRLAATSLQALVSRVAASLDLRLHLLDDVLLAAPSHDASALRRFYRRTVVPVPAPLRDAVAPAIADVADVELVAAIEGGVLLAGVPDALAVAVVIIGRLTPVRSDRDYVEFRPQHLDVTTLRDLAVTRFPDAELTASIATGRVIGRVAREDVERVREALSGWDLPPDRRRYRCRYAEPAAVMEAVTAAFPSVSAVIAGDRRSISVRTTPAVHAMVAGLVSDIDRPPRQVRFDLCIIQFQSGRAVQHGIEATLERDAAAVAVDPITAAAAFDGVLALRFDLISRLGYRAALAISDELSSNRARLVLDTSLRALDADMARIENSSTFRYRDVVGSEGDSGWQSVVREITSGLSVELTGTLHDDRSVTVNVRVTLSRQGADLSRNGNPPPTSERLVESTIRVRPGEPVVIGGLLQQEETASEHRFPVFGRVPVLRSLINRSDTHREESELVLYLSAFPDPENGPAERRRTQLERLRRLAGVETQ